MPAFDGTGPNGLGKLTGQGRGGCNGDSANNVEGNFGSCRGRFGRGCRRNGGNVSIERIESLLVKMQTSIDSMQKRLEELEKN